MIKFEAAPYTYTKGDNVVKNELYARYFDVGNLANLKGERPVKGYGFLESDSGYANRLSIWEDRDKDVLFEGWVCKDMSQWQIFTNLDDSSVSVQFNLDDYTITVNEKEYLFPVLPETIDDLINDFKRVGVKLYWKENVVQQFGLYNVTSDRKVVEYHKIMKDL